MKTNYIIYFCNPKRFPTFLGKRRFDDNGWSKTKSYFKFCQANLLVRKLILDNPCSHLYCCMIHIYANKRHLMCLKL